MHESMTDTADAVRSGLTAPQKTLPSWLLYDDTGYALFERITTLAEYGLTRAETEIFEKHGRAIIATVAEGGAPLSIAELGAGSATKTEILLRSCPPTFEYLACDMSRMVVETIERLQHVFPKATLRALIGKHDDARHHIAALQGRQALLFLGSSIGNFNDDDAAALLRTMKRGLRRDAVVLIGTDLLRDPADHVLAYDDPEGVTAAFNKNVLERINRELEADFVVDRFRHVALWNGRDVEMHLESVGEQRVKIRALDLEIKFNDGETIHTETSAKYDLKRIDAIFEAAGLSRARSFTDRICSFAVHLARPV
jgi:L-histidine Nalpha-methyltransferase